MGTVGNENKGAVGTKVGSVGGKQDAVEERETVRKRYLEHAFGRYLHHFFFCPYGAGGGLCVRTRW